MENKQIKDYPEYKIYTDGTIKNIKNNMVKPTIRNGKLWVKLSNQLGRKFLSVSSLMISNFLDIDCSNYQIKHKDNNKLNNEISNLSVFEPVSFEKETWKEIPNYCDYLASNYGRVKSLITNKILTQYLNKSGYLTVTLVNINGSGKKFLHRIIASAFLGISNLQINHKDGDKENNCIDNLEYCTSIENHKHAVLNNLKAKGKKINTCILDEGKVIDIRKQYKIGKRICDLAKEYNVSWSCIKFIVNNKNWSWLKNA